MKYKFTMYECDNCPKCGYPIFWNMTFSEEESYTAVCEKCGKVLDAKESNNFTVTDKDDI